MTDTVDTLKQRIVGAFVIISLAVIFLPMIFDEPRETASNVIVSVPPRPAFKVIEIDKPKRPEFKQIDIDPVSQKIVEIEPQLAPQLSDETQQLNLKQREAEPVEAQPKRSNLKPTVNHLPLFKNVWMVQLGTFSNTQNAYQLRDKLRKDGFDGHTKPVDLNGKKAIRVFTGPFVDKSEAEKTKQKLDTKYKVVSRVLFFDA
tara:strand:- start:389 stop:994 length:606 start_codon:yes stop_codon:yes gene_type:complete